MNIIDEPKDGIPKDVFDELISRRISPPLLSKEQVRQLAIEHGLIKPPVRFELKNVLVTSDQTTNFKYLKMSLDKETYFPEVEFKKWNVTFEQVE